MIISVPGHDLADYERETVTEHLTEVTSVTASWEERGGVYVPDGKTKRWVGLDPEPRR